MPNYYWEPGCENINENLTDEQKAQNVEKWEALHGDDDLPFDPAYQDDWQVGVEYSKREAMMNLYIQ